MRIFLSPIGLQRCLRLLSLVALQAYSLVIHAEELTSPLEAKIAQRIATRPEDAASWRLLGQLRLQRDDVDGAIAACSRALELAPNNASVHFGIARSWLAAGELQQATYHFEQVLQVAPDSDYAREASVALQNLPVSTRAAPLSPIQAELEPNRFGGIALANSSDTSAVRLEAQVEFGAVYNSNVQLAPISRVVDSPGLGSFQGFLAPQLEYRFLEAALWKSGISFNGYFTLNESELSEFDLQDYQPGIFLERAFATAWGETVYRVQYDFTLDEFAGSTFGTRHALTNMLTLDRGTTVSLIYWTTDFSNFSDDGVQPTIDSLDGWTNTLGFSHAVIREHSLLQLLRGGVDLQWAPLEGADYAYRGVFVYGEGELPLLWQTCLSIQTGWGYRQYPDFTGDPTRDEQLWRASAVVRKNFGDQWELTSYLTFDRFMTENVLFDAERYVTGVTTTFRY